MLFMIVPCRILKFPLWYCEPVPLALALIEAVIQIYPTSYQTKIQLSSIKCKNLFKHKYLSHCHVPINMLQTF